MQVKPARKCKPTPHPNTRLISHPHNPSRYRVHVWVDRQAGSTRVDYNDGLQKTYYIKVRGGSDKRQPRQRRWRRLQQNSSRRSSCSCGSDKDSGRRGSSGGQGDRG